MERVSKLEDQLHVQAATENEAVTTYTPDHGVWVEHDFMI
jgi:hypothetical protein